MPDLQRETLMQLVARIIADKVLEAWEIHGGPRAPDPAPRARLSQDTPVAGGAKCPYCSRRFFNLRGLTRHISAARKRGDDHEQVDK